MLISLLTLLVSTQNKVDFSSCNNTALPRLRIGVIREMDFEGSTKKALPMNLHSLEMSSTIQNWYTQLPLSAHLTKRACNTKFLKLSINERGSDTFRHYSVPRLKAMIIFPSSDPLFHCQRTSHVNTINWFSKIERIPKKNVYILPSFCLKPE